MDGKKFRDFEMEFDFRFWEGTVDSGVHLRTQDQIQIGISGSSRGTWTCSPYIPGKGHPVEAKNAAKLLKAKDWNHMKIRASVPKYTVWLQGKEVMNYESSSAKPKVRSASNSMATETWESTTRALSSRSFSSPFRRFPRGSELA